MHGLRAAVVAALCSILMRIRVVVGVALWLGGLLAQGCAEEEAPMRAPNSSPRPRDSGSSAPPPPPPPAAMDAGPEKDAGIFGLDSGQLRTECEEITPVPFIGEDVGDEYADAIAMPSDLLASRVVATWSGSCDPAAIKVEMSDGECPDGDGHALTFLLDALAIRDGTLGLGLHDVVPDSSGGPIRVRYIRPARFAPQGEWGSCDGVTGTFNIAGMPGTRKYNELQAQFEMKLTPCDGSDLAPQSVQGTFNVELRRSLDTVCPP